MGKQDELVQASRKVLVENYGRLPFAAARGRGAKLWNADGKEYIDFFPGFGAGGVGGHCHPKIVEAVKAQAETLLSHGNLFTSAPQVDLAERITRNGFGGKVFFCQSGAEANEAALKLVRLAARGGERKADGPYKVISFHNCFHGRTMGALSITPSSFQAGFEPMLPGGVQVDFGDLSAVEAAVDEQTAGVFIEAIQVEGGLNVGSVEFLRGLRRLCDDRGLLLVIDEVWTAPGRTGKMFAINHYDIEPDAVTLGKAIGGGLPVGAMVAHPKWADVLGPGTHGSTMGGNPICTAAGAAAMKLIEDENLCARAAALGEQVRAKLTDAAIPCVKDVRGRGLLLGMELNEAVAAKDVMSKCMERGLIVCIAKKNVVRLAPPLTVEEDLLAQGLDILIDVLTE
jgi:predicted acetylornithine/succinylornithine family transaminase